MSDYELNRKLDKIISILEDIRDRLSLLDEIQGDVAMIHDIYVELQEIKSTMADLAE